jgi:hypothetical protein
MTITERALISWIPADQGGRQAPPAGPRYVTVARFEEDEQWPDRAWSLVIEFVKTVDRGRYTLASVRFLAEEAPSHLLHRGSRFTLMEGARRVAKGVVLSPSTPVPDQMSEFEASLIG